MTITLELRTIVSKPFDENTYLAWLPGEQKCLVVDPGMEPDLILDRLRASGLEAAAILNTHGHVDHIAGNRALKDAFPAAPLVIGSRDAEMLLDPLINLSAFIMPRPVVSPAADRTVAEGDVLELAGIRLEVLDIPGHSPGHVVFLCRETAPWTVFGGDVLFAGSIGRTDFPGGSLEQLLSGIRTRLLTLPADTIVLPGHGPATTTGKEAGSNPFLQEANPPWQ